ncbi:MAG: hypothetical protein ABEJ65_06855, partial [bacterium]
NDDENDFHFAVRTSEQIEFGDTFTVEIRGGDLTFSVEKSAADDTAITHTIKAGIPILLTDLTDKPDQAFSESNSPLDVIGINAGDTENGEFMEEVTVTLSDTGDDDFSINDIADIKSDSTSGVSIWKDANDNGVFEQNTDTYIEPTSISDFSNNRVKFTLSGTNDDTAMPDKLDNTQDFFVVLKPSNTIGFGDDFVAGIPEGGIKTTTRESLKSITTRAIIGDDINNTVMQNLVSDQQRIEVSSPATEVLGIDVQDKGGSVTLDVVTVQFLDVGDGEIETSHLDSFDSGGLAIYRDQNGNGQFDPDQDLKLSLSGSESWTSISNGFEVDLTLASDVDLPDDNSNDNNGSDFFVTTKTAGYGSSLEYLDDFKFKIPQDGISYSKNEADQVKETNSFVAGVPTKISDRAQVNDRSFLPAFSDTTSIIGINARADESANDTANLQSVTVEFVNEKGFDLGDFVEFSGSTNGPDSGVTLWRESGGFFCGGKSHKSEWVKR